MHLTPDTCLKNGTCNQSCNQGRSCPRVARLHTLVSQGAKVANVGNVRAIHPAAQENGDWLTTPGQLERTEDERTGRVATTLEHFAIAMVVVFTVIIGGVGGIAIYAHWGDAIASGIGRALLAWGRVWT